MGIVVLVLVMGDVSVRCERERTDEIMRKLATGIFASFSLLLVPLLSFVVIEKNVCCCWVPLCHSMKKSQQKRNDPWPRFGCRCIVSLFVDEEKKKSPMTLFHPVVRFSFWNL